MGGCRFKLSAMVPNAWFYKLNDMGRTRNHCNNIHHPPKKQNPTTTLPKTPKHHSHQRLSNQYSGKVYITAWNTKASSGTKLPNPPSKGSRRRTKGIPAKPSSRLAISSTSVDCSCRMLDSVRNAYTSKTSGRIEGRRNSSPRI